MGAAAEPRAEGAGRLLYLDVLRVVASLMVVMGHVIAAVVLDTAAMDSREWHSANLIAGLTRPAVPLFFMLSGALNLAPLRSVDVRSFYRRRLVRIVVPYLAWTAFFIVWGLLVRDRNWWPRKIAWAFVSGSAYRHLWFLPWLIWFGLLTPAVARWLRPEPLRRAYRLGLGLSTLGMALIAFHDELGAAGVAVTCCCVYFGYYLFGYVLANLPVTRLVGHGAALVAAVGIAAIILGVAQQTVPGQPRDNTFFDYYSPAVFFPSLALFVCFRAYCSGERAGGRLLAWLGPLSLGIYLIHPAVINVFRYDLGLPAFPAWLPPALPMALLGLLVFTISAALVDLLRRLPGGRLLAP